MKLDPDIARQLNEQITVEAQASFVYWSLASWADTQGLTGCANWFRAEAGGEMDHMHQFVQYLNDRGFQATFGTIEAPPTEFGSLLEVFEIVHDQEQRLTARINELIQTAQAKGDHITTSFLNGFIRQQLADEAASDEILQRIRLVGNDGQGLLLIDQELGSSKGD